MNEVHVVPTAQLYAGSFNAAVDIVARERRYIGFVEGPSIESTREFIRRILAGAGVQMLAVASADVVVGWCDIVRNPNEGFRHVGRLGMGLLPDYRGRGLGRRLAVQTIAAARQAGIERVELDVFASNEPAIALYRALDFVTEGIKRRARKLDGQYDDNVFMALLDDSSRSKPRAVFEGVTPILPVRSLDASIDFYVNVLAFAVDFVGPGRFASVSRDGCHLFLSEGDQGNPGTWAWIGVEDVEALLGEYRAKGYDARHPPTNYPWAYEMQIEDPDGNVLRVGSERRADRPDGTSWRDMRGARWERSSAGEWARAED